MIRGLGLGELPPPHAGARDRVLGDFLLPDANDSEWFVGEPARAGDCARVVGKSPPARAGDGARYVVKPQPAHTGHSDLIESEALP